MISVSQPINDAEMVKRYRLGEWIVASRLFAQLSATQPTWPNTQFVPGFDTLPKPA